MYPENRKENSGAGISNTQIYASGRSLWEEVSLHLEEAT